LPESTGSLPNQPAGPAIHPARIMKDADRTCAQEVAKMAKYLFIESRDPFGCRDSESLFEMVEGSARNGNEVTLFLIQNGVLSLPRHSRFSQNVNQLMKSNVQVHADRFSLQERAVPEREILEKVIVSSAADLVALLLKPGMKAVWH